MSKKTGKKLSTNELVSRGMFQGLKELAQGVFWYMLAITFWSLLIVDGLNYFLCILGAVATCLIMDVTILKKKLNRKKFYDDLAKEQGTDKPLKIKRRSLKPRPPRVRK